MFHMWDISYTNMFMMVRVSLLCGRMCPKERPKGHRSWVSSVSIVDENSVHAILTKGLDCQSVFFMNET